MEEPPAPEPPRDVDLQRKARDLEKRLHRLSVAGTADPKELEALYIKLDVVKNKIKRQMSQDRSTPLPESRIFRKKRFLQAIHGIS